MAAHDPAASTIRPTQTSVVNAPPAATGAEALVAAAEKDDEL